MEEETNFSIKVCHAVDPLLHSESWGQLAFLVDVDANMISTHFQLISNRNVDCNDKSQDGIYKLIF